MPYRTPAEIPPDPPELREIKPPSRRERINFYIVLFFGFAAVIHVLSAIVIALGTKPEMPWHQIGQVGLMSWLAIPNYQEWRKARRERLRGV